MKRYKVILFSFLLIPFFRPIGLELSGFQNLYNFFFLWKIAVFFAFPIIAILKNKRITISNDYKFIMAYIAYTLINSVFIQMMLFNRKLPVVSLVSFVILPLIIMYLIKLDYCFFVKFLFFLLLFLQCFNLIFIIVPQFHSMITLSTYYFIGHRQSLPMVWCISVLLCVLEMHENKIDKARKFINSIIIWIHIIIATVNLLFASVSTGIIVLFFFTLTFILLVTQRFITRIKDGIMYIVYCGGFFLNYLIIFCNFQNNFEYYLKTFLNETTTMNGRTDVFKAFINTFYYSKWIGYGYNGVQANVGWGGDWNFLDYAHNSILQELANGGIIGLFLFFIMGLFSIRFINKIENLQIKTIVICTFVAELVIMCSESVNYYNYYMLFIIVVTSLYSANNLYTRKITNKTDKSSHINQEIL